MSKELNFLLRETALPRHAQVRYTRTRRSRVKEIQTSSENRGHRHVITIQLRARIVTAERIRLFLLKFDLCAWTEAAAVAMSFQGYQEEVNTQVEHENSGADVRAQLMQFTQVQLAQIVSSTASQTLTQQIQNIAQPV